LDYTKGSPFSGEEIRDRACSQVIKIGNTRGSLEFQVGTSGYNLWENNCEHFANWCRYGIRHSQQTHEAGTKISYFSNGALVGALGVMSIVGLAFMFNPKRSRKDYDEDKPEEL